MAPAELLQTGQIIRIMDRPDQSHRDKLNGISVSIEPMATGCTIRKPYGTITLAVGESVALDSSVVVISK